jgi:hypothetical protein
MAFVGLSCRVADGSIGAGEGRTVLPMAVVAGRDQGSAAVPVGAFQVSIG